MDLIAQYKFPADAARVWDLLIDPRVISSCLPGCEAFETLGGDRYRVVLNVGVAAITGSFEGTVEMADKNPPVSYRLTVDGRGRPGFVTGGATITLVDHEDGVAVQVAGVAHAGGLIAQVGQRLLGATARMMMDRFFNCLQTRLGVN